ncbi:MAG: membrane protein insertase YidC [Armatimonadota bacterium]
MRDMIRGRWLVPVLVLLLPVILGGCMQSPSPLKAQEFYQKGQALEKEGRLDAAAEAYTKALSSDPQGGLAAEVGLKLAELSEKLGKYDAAVGAYKAVKGLPGSRTVVISGRKVDAKAEAARRLEAAIVKADRQHAHKITYRFLDALVAMTGRNPHYSYALAIFIFTLLVKILMTPLTKSQFAYMQKMNRLQPLMREIQERYADRKEEMNRRLMALYKEHGVNPLGCGFNSMLQMAILIMLYGVIRDYSYQFEKGYFLWINPALAKVFPNVVGSNLAYPDLPLLVLYAISMYVSQKVTMLPSADPQQQQQQRMMAIMMPIMFLFILRAFPSAFTLYWLIFNVLTTAQQLHLMHRSDLGAAVTARATETSAETPARRPTTKKRRR